jgi:hypothetical protein
MMKPSSNQPPSSSVGSSSSRPSDLTSKTSVSSLDRQLARLFGESLFGPWLDPSEWMPLSGRARKPGAWIRRIAIAFLAVVVVAGGAWLAGYGFYRHEAQERARVAKDVAAFLAEGELERLAQFLAILSPATDQLQATDPYLDLIVQAEAALYRYHDASPARLERVSRFLAADDGFPRRFVARMTVASLAERSAAYPRLSKLPSSLAADPEIWALLASVEEGRNVVAARRSWERAFEAGPLWLPHRYQQCLFEARQGRTDRVARLVNHMVKVDPDSPWTHLAQSLRARSPVSALGATAPAVAQHHQQLALVFEGAHPGEVSAARRQALGRALDAVQGGAPFVLDVFDRLMAVHAKDLAAEMTSYEAWPRDNPFAQARLEGLSVTGTMAPTAASTAEPLTATPSSPSVRNSRAAKTTKNETRARQRGGRSWR